MRKSILFLTNAYPDFESSYRGIFIKRMALYLNESGHRVSVVTPKIYKDSPYFEEQNSIPVYRFPFFSGDKLLIEHETIPYLQMVIYFITGFFFTLYAILKNHCDLIHVHWAIPTGPIGVIAGVLFRKPLIVTVHGSDLRLAVSGSSLLKRIFVRVCHRARHIHSVSKTMKREIEQLGISGNKISTWPMGVDEGFLQSGRNRKKKSIGAPMTVLSDRNLLPIYDVMCLIRAIPLVLREEPRVRFLIAGEGSDREDVEREAQDLDVRSSAQFLGRVPHTQMPDLLAQGDIYVSTSLSDGTSVSLLEALAAGLFPVVTDIPANREWVTDGETGFLVPAGNESKLADRIIEAIRNAEMVGKASKMNQKIAEENAYWRKNIRKIVEAYENSFKAT